MLKNSVLFLLLYWGTITGILAQLSTDDVTDFEELLAQRNYSQALSYARALNSRQQPESIEKAHSRLLLSRAFQENRQFDKAEKILDSLLHENQFLHFPNLLTETWFQKGILSDSQNREATAVNYFLKVDSMTNGGNITPRLQTRALTAIGDLLFQWRYMKIASGYSKPSHFYGKALKVAEQTGDSTAWYSLKLRLAFLAVGNPAKKLEAIPPVFDESIIYFKQNKEIIPLLEALHRLSKLHTIRGNTNEAEALYMEYIRIAKEYNLTENEAQGNWQFAILLENIQKLPEAIGAYEKAKLLYESEKPMFAPTNYSAVLGALAGLYRKTGQLDKAFDHLVLFHNIRDSVDAMAQMDRVKELDSRYQSEEKDNAISLLELKNQQKNTQILSMLLVGILILSATFFYFYRQKHKIKLAKQISQLDSLKRTFFANISHEFRTPLTLIKSPVQQLQSTADDNAQKQLSLIDSNANRMLDLVDQLLELSKMDSGELQIILKKGDVSSFLHSLIESFEFQAKENSIDFEVEILPGGDTYFFDKDIFTKIVTNLLGNAFKYHDKGSPISFHASIKNRQLCFEVSNDNSQLMEGDVKKLFDRFYQKNAANPGAGIGLALVKDLVDVYEGTITARKVEKKLTFSVTLPLDKNKKNVVIIEEKSESDYPHTPAYFENEEELPILLIADDNSDIRTVLVAIFAQDYVVIQAENGQEAYEAALKEIPDCIIADVMMPKMDGFSLAKNLKQNELTASVPVILLTAKTGDKARLEGLQSHADAYLTKPFNHEIVKATVLQQLQERKKLRERYSRELVLKPLDIIINSADEKFIDRLEKVLETEIASPAFTSEAFAEKMHLSRMQLHRKLKLLLGVSATEFIRNERLKAAAELLGNKSLSVSEVAYSVGFNDVGYFSKSFKETYGFPPSEYKKEI